MDDITCRMRQIADIAEQLPTGLIDHKAIEKMNREAREAWEARDRVGYLMEVSDVCYYATKAFYNMDINHKAYRLVIGIMASISGVQENLLLDICIAKMSMRTHPNNPKNDEEKRAAVIAVLYKAGPNAY